MKQLGWCQSDHSQQVLVKVPLLFTFPPVQTLMKELTKLNSNHIYRIAYLGPRWSDSVTFHKKYSNGGYVFNERKISKNSGLVNSMLNNQFYKNQIFYRAFEGMNPTLNLQQQLIFQSRFEGGNLDCVVKVSNHEYDLFLRIDSNTRGNLFWFYFAVRKCQKGKRVKFNICNLTKSGTHYQKGLNPYIYSSITKNWSQEGMTNLTFKEKRFRYDFLYERMKLRNFYELSFEVQFKGEEEILFAYCIPYTYSDLLKDIKQISSVAQVATLGQTFTGVNIPVVMIGKNEEKVQKQVLFITGRVHPGQSNSSLVLSNLMKYLCFSNEAKYLRQKVITVIVPMINPDGVILGNSRCGASGKDLNRQFRSTSKVLFPQVVLIKNLVDKIMQTHELEVYLDFHGHSRKKNMFIFGPSYNLTQPQYYKCRVLPKILSNVTPIFRYFSCSYDIPNDKKNTARSVMLSEMLVPLVYTVQTSLGFYHDYNIHKDVPFTIKKWQQVGQNFVIALKEYYQGIEQYDLFIQAKQNSKKMLVQVIKQSALCTNPPPSIFRKASKDQKKEMRQIKDPKQLKYFRLFQEIKKEEQKKIAKEEKKQKQGDSQSESDSHNQEQQLQKEKMRQFSGMIAECVQQEVIKQKNMNSYNQKQKKSKKNVKIQPVISRKVRQQQILKKRSIKNKEQQKILLQNTNEESKTKTKRKDVRTESKQRENSLKKNQIYVQNIKGLKQFSEGLKKIYPSFRQEDFNHQERQEVLAKHHYLDDDVDFLSVQKKSNNKMNIRMFNFSKMVQNNNPLRYNEQKNKEVRIMLPCQPQSMQQHKDFSRSLNFEYPVQKTKSLNLHNIVEEQEHPNPNPNRRSEQSRHQKTKTAFPPSFYRIKYHNSQRKRQEIKRQRQLSDFEQYKKISYYHDMTNQVRQTNYKQSREPQYVSSQFELQDEEQESKQKLSAYLKRFPFH